MSAAAGLAPARSNCQQGLVVWVCVSARVFGLWRCRLPHNNMCACALCSLHDVEREFLLNTATCIEHLYELKQSSALLFHDTDVPKGTSSASATAALSSAADAPSPVPHISFSFFLFSSILASMSFTYAGGVESDEIRVARKERPPSSIAAPLPGSRSTAWCIPPSTRRRSPREAGRHRRQISSSPRLCLSCVP